MSEKQVVISVFEDEAAADGAVQSLKAWDKVSKEVKLGAIGVLALDDKGQVKTQKIGRDSDSPNRTGGGWAPSWAPARPL
ncbi:MAG: hypothetical protein E6J41_06950 [Chloroflexi bacterium]|nr:MAG: hypothetical protein E6J41_06950 [Chloroflexota bacterium]